MKYTDKNGFSLIEVILSLIITTIIIAGALDLIDYYIGSNNAIQTVKAMKQIGKAENLYYYNSDDYNVEAPNCNTANNPGNEVVHDYTSNFSDLIGYLGSNASNDNYFNQPYTLAPIGISMTLNSNNYCVESTGILISTYIPLEYKNAVYSLPGAFDVGTNGNMEEVGYYTIPTQDSSTENNATLKYNW